MSLFPVTRPRLGVSICPRSLTLVELRPRWRPGRQPQHPGIRRWLQQATPEGLMTHSASRQIIPDTSKLSAALVELRGNRRRMVSAGIGLPDSCGHMALLEFDSLPKRSAEFEGLLRWRLERELNVPATGARLAYRLFQQTVGAGTGTSTTRVLATMIEAPVLQSYQEACLQVGLLPVTVGLDSLHVYELCRPAMQRDLEQCTRETGGPVAECFFVHWADWGFSFLAFRLGSPVFVRTKPWAVAREHPAKWPQLSDRTAALGQELVATIQFYQETAGSMSSEQVRPLFLIVTAHESAEPDQERAYTTCTEGLRPWNVVLSRLEWNSVFNQPATASGPGIEEFPLAGLPALAAAQAG